ncbi:GxxExxY protein [bacterium]|nr:GxxExxY protein [bacterium]
MTDYKYAELTGKIIGCAMRVHSALGNGFQEVIYQRALAIELDKVKLLFDRELEMPLNYGECEIGT